jgi:hypothetical protein
MTFGSGPVDIALSARFENVATAEMRLQRLGDADRTVRLLVVLQDTHKLIEGKR